jgi:hypothetical protein
MGGMGGQPPTSCNIPGTSYNGNGSFTWYHFSQGTGRDGSGYRTACGHYGTASGMTDTVQNIASTSPASSNYFVAFPGEGPSNFDTVRYCGACIQATNGSRSIIATVIDQCPKDSNPLCRNAGHLDLSYPAWQALGYSVGNPSNTTWRFVPCPVSGNIIVRIKPGNADQVYIENTITGINTVTMNGSPATHLSYGAWDLPGNAAGATLNLTDLAGRTVTVRVNGSTMGLNQDTGVQFPRCQ